MPVLFPSIFGECQTQFHAMKMSLVTIHVGLVIKNEFGQSANKDGLSENEFDQNR